MGGPRTNHDFYISYISSGDSTGSTPAQSKAAYDTIIGQHPDNILTLNHETYGKFMNNAPEDFVSTLIILFLKKPPCEHTPYYSFRIKNHWC